MLALWPANGQSVSRKLDIQRQLYTELVGQYCLRNEVIVTYRDFVPAISAVIVPARKGVPNPRTLAAATAAAREVSEALARPVPTLLLETEPSARGRHRNRVITAA